MRKLKQEKGTETAHKKGGKLGLVAWIFGLHKKKVWFIAPKWKKPSGPYTLKELKEKFSGTKVTGDLKIRKGEKGKWISWSDALKIHPLLAYTNISISKKRQKQPNKKYGKSKKYNPLSALTEKTNAENSKQHKQGSRKNKDENEVWFLQPKKQKMKGPHSLRKLTEVLKGYTADDGVRIRKGKSGQWVAWINAPDLHPMLPKPGESTDDSALFTAVDEGDISRVKTLVGSGVNVNAIYYGGKTALMIASGNGDTRIVKLLLEAGARVNTSSQSDGMTPLLLASWFGHSETATCLLEAGADPNAVLKNKNFSALYVAYLNEHFDLIPLLINFGCNVDAKSSQGLTTLASASENGNIDIVRLLLEAGADVNIADNNYGTPLLRASQNGHLKTVELLIEQGAKVNSYYEDGTSPLLMAAQGGYAHIAKFLLMNGADFTTARNDGATPLKMASQHGHNDIVDLIDSFENQVYQTLKNYATIPEQKNKDSQIAEIASQSVTAEEAWFKDPTQRNQPYGPSEFDLFSIPSYPLDEWADEVISDPWEPQCTKVNISNLGSVTKTLFDKLKEEYGVKSSMAVPIFNTYLGAACPECFSGLTGELLQTVESYKSAAGAVLMGNSDNIERIMNGKCIFCSSNRYYVVWHGDK